MIHFRPIFKQQWMPVFKWFQSSDAVRIMTSLICLRHSFYLQVAMHQLHTIF